MLKKRIALTLGITWLLTGSAQAQIRVAPEDPVADRLVAEALQKTPEVISARAVTEAALHRVDPAGTLPDPMFSLSVQNETRDLTLGEMGGSFVAIMASQSLPWPGKLSLARGAARSQAREMELGVVGRAERSMEARVRNGWYDLLLTRSIQRLLEDRREAARQIEASVRERYAAGLAVQQDVLRAQVELVRLEEAVQLQQARLTSLIAELNRVLGRAQDAPFTESGALPPVSAVSTDVIASVLAASPEVAASRQGLESGHLAVEVAKKNFLPDFVVSGGTMYRGEFEMGPMWQLGVAVSIPAWITRRQQNELAAASADLRARTSDRERVSAELELRTRERLAQLDAAVYVAELYREKILPLDELALESALASYSAGKVPFISVLDALNGLYTDRATHLSRVAESAKWRVAIDEASLQPVSMSPAPAMSSNPTSMTTGAASMPAASTSSSSVMR